jgi:hypothetical protein
LVRLPDGFPEGVVGERQLSGNSEPGMVLAWVADFRVRTVALPDWRGRWKCWNPAPPTGLCK